MSAIGLGTLARPKGSQTQTFTVTASPGKDVWLLFSTVTEVVPPTNWSLEGHFMSSLRLGLMRLPAKYNRGGAISGSLTLAEARPLAGIIWEDEPLRGPVYFASRAKPSTGAKTQWSTEAHSMRGDTVIASVALLRVGIPESPMPPTSATVDAGLHDPAFSGFVGNATPGDETVGLLWASGEDVGWEHLSATFTFEPNPTEATEFQGAALAYNTTVGEPSRLYYSDGATWTAFV